MVKRFDVKTCMLQENEGKYVFYDDYAELKSELAQQTTRDKTCQCADGDTWRSLSFVINCKELNYCANCGGKLFTKKNKKNLAH